MKWEIDGPCAITREDGRYTISRAPQDGGPIVYTLAERGNPWARVHVLRDVPAQVMEMRAAVVALKNMCEGVQPAATPKPSRRK